MKASSGVLNAAAQREGDLSDALRILEKVIMLAQRRQMSLLAQHPYHWRHFFEGYLRSCM